MDAHLPNNQINLPAPPLRTAVDEGDLLNAKVIAHLLDGSDVSGVLLCLDATNELLVLQTESEIKTTKLRFIDICQLEFTKNIVIASDTHPIEQYSSGVELPPPNQPYLVNSENGCTSSGVTRGSFLDLKGIHIFKVTNEKLLQRIFFPIATVRNYQIGNLIGKELKSMKGKDINSQSIDDALKAQQALRGKKTVDYLVENNDISIEELNEIVSLHGKGDADKGSASNVSSLLVKGKRVTREQLSGALKKEKIDKDKKLGAFLQEMDAVNDNDLNLALARKSGIPYVPLQDYDIQPAAIELISRDIACKYSLVPLQVINQSLVVAMEDPFQKEAIDTIQFLTNLHLDLVVSSKLDIETAIKKYYHEDTFEKDILEAEDVQNIFSLDKNQKEELREAEVFDTGKPIVRLVANFIMDAIQHQASDVHIRPLEKSVDLLFRIDGVLFKIKNFSKTLLPSIINRIKIIGKMDIAERRLPQDGQSRISDKGNVVDLRISIIPTVNGESAVIRLLNTNVGIRSISQLGFNPRDAEAFNNILHKSNGMILVTGPTGSGKSTTLYAALQTVIARNLNIITVENPVEYHIDGIEQIQVNTVPGYTFARSLRHILRHDPDVIMIGEIRDEETAKIAVESALTGHLVLSTLHTNDSAGAITRLLEMGVDPFLINAVMLGIFAQRLVRKNCRECISEESVDPVVRKALGVSEDETFYKGQGCTKCNDLGYKGRLAVYELLRITSDMHHLIQPEVPNQVIHDQAIKDGMTPLTENALQQARKKLTSLEEVYRVRLED